MRRANNPAYPDHRISGLRREEKLTLDAVDEIRRRYRHHSRDANCRVLAKEFGVSATTVHNIVREKKWRVEDWTMRSRSVQPRNRTNHSLKTAWDALDRNFQSALKQSPNANDLRVQYEAFGRVFGRPAP